jgi:hypothetical protein
MTQVMMFYGLSTFEEACFCGPEFPYPELVFSLEKIKDFV